MAKYVVHIPEPLHSKICDEVLRAGMNQSEIIRRAVAKYFETPIVPVKCGNPQNIKIKEMNLKLKELKKNTQEGKNIG